MQYSRVDYITHSRHTLWLQRPTQTNNFLTILFSCRPLQKLTLRVRYFLCVLRISDTLKIRKFDDIIRNNESHFTGSVNIYNHYFPGKFCCNGNYSTFAQDARVASTVIFLIAL